MCVFEGVGPAAVAEHVLSNVGAGDLVQMGCGGVTKQPGVQFFIDTELIGCGTEDILQGARRDAFFAFGYEQRSFFAVPGMQITLDDFTKTVRQEDVSLPASFFPDPQQAAGEVDIFDIQGGQGTGSKSQGAQQHDDNEISQAKGRACLVGEVAN